MIIHIVKFCDIINFLFFVMVSGIGPVTAIKLIREHKSLEKVLENIDGKVRKELTFWKSLFFEK